MAIVGAMADGLKGDYSILAVKAVLDFIIIAIMSSTMGRGCIFSAIPVFIFEGAMTLLARLVSPVVTDTAVTYLSLVGSTLIFCIGINLVWGVGKTLFITNYFCGHKSVFAVLNSRQCTQSTISVVCLAKTVPQAAISSPQKCFAPKRAHF